MVNVHRYLQGRAMSDVKNIKLALSFQEIKNNICTG